MFGRDTPVELDFAQVDNWTKILLYIRISEERRILDGKEDCRLY